MLSICIAIHNWDVNALVNELVKQADRLEKPYEVILLDDASDHEFQMKNSQLDFLEHVTYLQSYINMGRSYVRNVLAARAKYPYLLFMDCDTRVTHKDYLKKYIDLLPAQVLSGGYEYKSRRPRKDSVLRWAYGRERETCSAKKRNKNPNYSFSTFNFLIEKKIFDIVQFDETLEGYGHEDTLFGLDLLSHGIIVRHIDNPLRHDVSITTSRFLKQTENAIDNLLVIQEKVADKEQFRSSISLLRHYDKLKKTNTLRFFLKFYKKFEKRIIANLKSTHPNMRCFDLYKLNYLSHIIENSNGNQETKRRK